MFRLIRLAAFAVILSCCHSVLTASATTSAHASPGVHWTSCVYRAGHHRHCTEYLMPKAPHAPISYWKHCTLRPHGVACTRYPTFTRPQPAGYRANYLLTIYSRCDTPGQWMADGTSVFSLAGQYGAAATYPGYPGGLAFGTRVLIYSLHRVVTIHDRGAPAYFQSPHIDVYDPSPSCSLFNNFAGLGSHYETVFVYR